MKVWDLHCDTLSELRRAEKNGTPASFAHNDLHIDLEKLQAGDYMLQCLAAFVNLADPTPGADPLVTALEEIDVFKRIMAKYPDRIAPVYTAADIVIHYDPWWNVAAQNQATDRAYRIGQKNPVQVYKLIAQDTIEEKIVELQQAKQDLAETVTGSADGAILSMKPEELLQLLQEE